MVNLMVKVLIHSRMEQYTQENLFREKSKVKVNGVAQETQFVILMMVITSMI